MSATMRRGSDSRDRRTLAETPLAHFSFKGRALWSITGSRPAAILAWRQNAGTECPGTG